MKREMKLSEFLGSLMKTKLAVELQLYKVVVAR